MAEIASERCFRIYLAANQAFVGVFEDTFENLAKAEGAAEMLKSVSQQQLQTRLSTAIECLCNSFFSEPELAGFDASALDRSHYAVILRSHFARIQEAEQTLAERNIPDGVLASMWRGAANSLTDPTAATANFFLPGIGSVLGGLLSGIQLSKKDDEAINTFRAAIETFRDQLNQVFSDCYAALIATAVKQGFRFSTGDREIKQTLLKLDAMSEALDATNSQEDLNRLENAAAEFISKYPFSIRGHIIYALVLLQLERFEEADREGYAAYTIDQKSHLALIVMLLARVALERWEDAAQTARAAVESCATEASLFETIGNALKEVPCPGLFADSIAIIIANLQKTSRPLAFLLDIRLSSALGQRDRCELTLSSMLQKAPIDIAEALLLRNDGNLGEILSKSFAGILSGPPDPIKIAGAALSHCNTLCFGGIPSQKSAAAQASFVRLKRGERLICYCDTTVFGGGREGFALTDARILWRELWSEPVSLSYSEIQNFEIEPVGDAPNLLTLVTRTGERFQYAEAPLGAPLGIFNFLTLFRAAEIATR